MVGTPTRRHSTRHRRTASILASRAISLVSPIRDSERRAERRRLQRQRERRRDAAFYKGLLAYCGVLPQLRRRRRRVEPRQPLDLPIVVASDTSSDNIRPPVRAPPIVVDLDSSIESLPDIDPRPQWQLPAQPLPDLGPLDVTAEISPQLQYPVFRKACVLLHRMQLPPLQQISPPPELQPRLVTPPPEQDETWVELEAAVAAFDGRHYVLVAQPPALQQRQVAPVPEHVPAGYQPPPPMPAVDWALVAHALFSIAEGESAGRLGNPN